MVKSSKQRRRCKKQLPSRRKSPNYCGMLLNIYGRCPDHGEDIGGKL